MPDEFAKNDDVLDSMWDSWDTKAEIQDPFLSVYISERTAYEAYEAGDLINAVSLYENAVNISLNSDNLNRACDNLFWQGHCLWILGSFKKALSCFLKAENYGELSRHTAFYNLYSLVHLSHDLALSKEEVDNLLIQIIPYRQNLEYGGSKSMVLNLESDILHGRGKNDEALSKAQEAFAERVTGSLPSYDDFMYYGNLIDSYRIVKDFESAHEYLEQWKREGSLKFSDTPLKQRIALFKLLVDEKKYDEVIDIIPIIRKEMLLLGQKNVFDDVWFYEIELCIATEDVSRINRLIFDYLKHFRNSESFDVKYKCYYSVLHYSLFMYNYSHDSKWKRHIKNWFKRTQGLALLLLERRASNHFVNELAMLTSMYNYSI